MDLPRGMTVPQECRGFEKPRCFKNLGSKGICSPLVPLARDSWNQLIVAAHEEEVIP